MSGNGKSGSRYFSTRTSLDLRRRPERKTFQVQKMWDTHREIARLSVIGMKGTEIADHLGVSSAMVNYTLNSPVVESHVEVMRVARDVDSIVLSKRILEFAPQCLDLLEDVIAGKKNDASIGLRVKTAQDWADRAGLGAVKKHQVMSAHLSREDLEEIKQRARLNGVVKS